MVIDQCKKMFSHQLIQKMVRLTLETTDSCSIISAPIVIAYCCMADRYIGRERAGPHDKRGSIFTKLLLLTVSITENITEL